MGAMMPATSARMCPSLPVIWAPAGQRPLAWRACGQVADLTSGGGRYHLCLVTEAARPRPEPASFRQRRFEPPPGAMELVLVRHGESEAYVDGSPFPLVGGHGDPPLSPQGAEQARRVCARLSRAGIDAIYVTTLRRTAQTAAPLAGQLGLEPRVEAGLREVYLGEWEGGVLRKMMADGNPAGERV